jgi:signal transduction histidine kinase/CheY-like chemotaxis protein
VTAVQRTETIPQAIEVTPSANLATNAIVDGQLLGELLLIFGCEESIEGFLASVCGTLLRGMGLEGVLLRLREGEVLRASVAVGFGADPAAFPSVGLDIHPWPDSAAPFALPPEVLSRVLPDGPMRWLGLHCVPLRSSKGVAGAMYLASSSARAFGLAESELLRTVGEALGSELSRRLEDARLRDGIRAREEALALVAHDLRNPLHAISVGVGTLLPRIGEPTLRRPVERIQRSAQRMERLLQDLLDIHAIEGGHFTVGRGQVAPTGLILTALDSQQSLAGSTSVIINTDVAPELPAVSADEERVLQVLENLVGNALKFTPAAGVVTVGAAPSTEPGWVLFSVRDTGPGIAPEHLPRVFDRFYQGQSSDRRGTGLGLAICRAIVEAHGGRIWAESEPGKGAAFYFTLPTAADAEPAPASEPASILLVDDKPENLTALRAILDRPDYNLVSATAGEEALRLALRERFAAALVDVAMPRMNGFEVAAHLKALERSRHIPIIFITAFGDDPEEIHRAYAAGGADYLVKPLDPEIVRKKVAVFVELSRKRHDSESAAPTSF